MRVDRIPYRTLVVNVAAALNRFEIDRPNAPVVGVEVRDVPAAAEPVSLHFGPQGDPVHVRQGTTVEVPGDSLGRGLYLSCAAGGAGKVVELVVLYEDAEQRGPAFKVRDP